VGTQVETARWPKRASVDDLGAEASVVMDSGRLPVGHGDCDEDRAEPQPVWRASCCPASQNEGDRDAHTEGSGPKIRHLEEDLWTGLRVKEQTEVSRETCPAVPRDRLMHLQECESTTG
jgi:hypothetical protein